MYVPASLAAALDAALVVARHAGMYVPASNIVIFFQRARAPAALDSAGINLPAATAGGHAAGLYVPTPRVGMRVPAATAASSP